MNTVVNHCKICGEIGSGPLHFLINELNRLMNERYRAEQRQALDHARYYAEREDVYRNELFAVPKFSLIGWHDFEAEDNLDMVERLAKERGLV